MAERIIHPSTYVVVFAVLIVLTLLTVTVSFVPLGSWHTLVGLGFATAKALLVAAFFMHLIASSRMTWIVAGAGIFWLGILLTLTMADYATRGVWSF
jgi:cytochrome c oxidase subunit 4